MTFIQYDTTYAVRVKGERDAGIFMLWWTMRGGQCGKNTTQGVIRHQAGHYARR